MRGSRWRDVSYNGKTYDLKHLRPDRGSPGGLTLFVTSAYEVDQWGKDTMPRGKAVKFNYNGYLRLNGLTYLPLRKQKRR